MAPGPCRLRGAARSGGRRRRRRRGSCGAATRVEGRRGIRWRPPVTRVYFIWRRRATRRGWGGGRGSDREARAPRPRASSGDGLRRGYYWRPVRQSYALAWPLLIGRPATSAVPLWCPVPSPTGTGFQLLARLVIAPSVEPERARPVLTGLVFLLYIFINILKQNFKCNLNLISFKKTNQCLRGHSSSPLVPGRGYACRMQSRWMQKV
jgi:hypothetical protein